MSLAPPSYQRVLLKVSGEALMGDKGFGYDEQTLKNIAEDIKSVTNSGIQVCMVIGGGNIYRGIDGAALGIERSSADYMGMLATVINAIAMQNIMEKMDISTRVQSSIPMTTISEPFIHRKAMRHMEKHRVVIFAAGIGSPFFTTDSAAVLRAIEMNCDCLFKGTNVDGVYDDDPKHNPQAKHYQQVTYHEVLRDNLQVMDMAAIAVARENNLPIKVFSIKQAGNFAKVIQGRGKFTIIKN
jgi:uridylate kinase